MCLLVNICGFVCGLAIAISSVMFPRLLEGETGMFAMKINTDEMSYLGDFFYIFTEVHKSLFPILTFAQLVPFCSELMDYSSPPLSPTPSDIAAPWHWMPSSA